MYDKDKILKKKYCVENHFMFTFCFFLFWIKYNVQWNVSVEVIKE